MKKYITPEIEIEIWAPNEDIMTASGEAEVEIEVTEEEETLKGIIDIESLINRVFNK